ncbi:MULTISPECIES: hypothetical protein [unclassified Microcoleus]
MRYSLAWGMGHGAWGMGLPRVPHKPAICCMYLARFYISLEGDLLIV